jgi:hypothetical protein
MMADCMVDLLGQKVVLNLVDLLIEKKQCFLNFKIEASIPFLNADMLLKSLPVCGKESQWYK